MQRSDDAFENAIKSLEASAARVGMHLEIDSTARRIYAREIKVMSDNTAFTQLTPSKQNRAFAEIVAAAGRSQPTVTRNVQRLSYLGSSVILLSLALSTYNVLTARNTSTAVKREVLTTTAGIGGSVAAGALAGLACGQGAPVCVTIGAFAGGALAAFGAGFIW